jgi:DNA-binding response OmpR family regulator
MPGHENPFGFPIRCQKHERDPADPDHIHTVWKVGYRFES